MRMRSLLAAAAAVLLSAASVAAQEWPSRPVTVVVPFTAGTTSDVIARGLLAHLQSALSQAFIVDNRSGAGGNFGGAVAAKAAPDGHTLFFATTGPAALNQIMYKEMPFAPQRDFEPVVIVGKAPIIFVAKTAAPFSTLKGLIDYAKENPGKITAGFLGNGTLGHIASELVQTRTDVKFEQVRYRGSPQLVTDLIAGNIDIGLDTTAAYAPLVQEGKVKALAIAGGKRWSKLPDVPLASEAGLPGFEASVWYAILAPTGTPPAVIAKLNAATNDYIKTARAQEFLETLGVESVGGTPAEAKAFITAEIEKWSPIIKAANISF